MTSALSQATEHPRDVKTGLILPLSKSLGSQALARHRATVAVELEVMAKKMDRFGWERDRGSVVSDRLLADWMDCLGNYPLNEVRDACRKWVHDMPRKMPNEGDIEKLITQGRKAWLKSKKPSNAPEPDRVEPSPEQKAKADKLVASLLKGKAI